MASWKRTPLDYLQISVFRGYCSDHLLNNEEVRNLTIQKNPPASDIPENNIPEKDIYWAAIQMLEHWQRCGCDQIVVGNEIASQEWSVASVQSPTNKPSQRTVTSGNSSEALDLNRLDQTNVRIPTSVYDATSASAPARAPLPSIPISGRPGSYAAAKAVNESVSDGSHQWLTESNPNEQRSNKLEVLQVEVASCTRCAELACTRKQTVFGVGAVNPRVVFFGEAPGADEDRLGAPFVGAAGQLLNKILAATQMHRDDVYILNSLKCRPPANRTPSDLEIENCRPYFESQLELLQPEFIVCLGAVAVRAVLKSTEPVGRLRGRFHRFRGAQVLVTYHPAYLLRNEEAKRLTWADMQLLMKAMGLKMPSK